MRPSLALAAPVCLTAASLVAAGVLLAPATASPAGDALVISEVYGGGGNSGATLTHDFVELYNPTAQPISVEGLSVQYRSAANSGTGATALSGSVPAGGHYLVQEAQGSGGSQALPAPDAEGSQAMSGTSGIVALVEGTEPVTLSAGDAVDLVGYGSAGLFEGTAPAPTLSSTTAATRAAAGTDTDDNAADLSAAAPEPQASGGGDDTPPEEPVRASIARVQGDGATSPLVGRRVTVRGVVTARYPSGGLDGLYLQTAGTGAGRDRTPVRSDAILVDGSALDETGWQLGDGLEVTGTVAEQFGVTALVPTAQRDVATVRGLAPVTPLAVPLPATTAEREAHEGELVAPQGRFTVTDSYDTGRFAEIGLAAGRRPLVQPTEVADAGSARARAVADDNAARAVTLDDGASLDFTGSASSTPVPYLTRPGGAPRPVRVGAPVSFTDPVVLTYGFGAWRFQPTEQLTSAEQPPVHIENTREAAPEAVPGRLRLATFNVLNYFPTTGEEYEAAGGSCTYYDDRAGEPVTTRDCGESGPRGAADAADLERQQAKIVAAINALGADVVSLEEIENSVRLDQPRDAALRTLVRALNADAGAGTWALVPSPPASALPPVEEQDVIRTAFIYRPRAVRTVGESRVLLDPAFANARQPLAQSFRPARGGRARAFTVIVNHFKSKGSGVDDGTGQGNANPDRVAQARALVDFADRVERRSRIARTLLTGDFNAYSEEDPLQVLRRAGWTQVESDTAGEETYSYDGMVGSLDHVLANDAALRTVRGADVWGISSPEAVAFEYSRFNANVSDLFRPDVFRASDHDPEIVGLTIPPPRG